MARHNDLIGHNTSPDRNKPNPSPNRPHAAEPTRKALVTSQSLSRFSQSIIAPELTESVSAFCARVKATVAGGTAANRRAPGVYAHLGRN